MAVRSARPPRCETVRHGLPSRIPKWKFHLGTQCASGFSKLVTWHPPVLLQFGRYRRTCSWELAQDSHGTRHALHVLKLGLGYLVLATHSLHRLLGISFRLQQIVTLTSHATKSLGKLTGCSSESAHLLLQGLNLLICSLNFDVARSLDLGVPFELWGEQPCLVCLIGQVEGQGAQSTSARAPSVGFNSESRSRACSSFV